MARGRSGRIVIELPPALKQRLEARLDAEGRTMKSWFLRHVEAFLVTENPPPETRARPTNAKVKGR